MTWTRGTGWAEWGKGRPGWLRGTREQEAQWDEWTLTRLWARPSNLQGPCRREAWAGGSGKAFNHDREGKVENRGGGRPGCSWGPWTGSKAATPRKDHWDPQPRDGVGAELRVRGRGHQVLRLPRAEGARLGRGRAAIPRPCASLQTQDATALSSRATRPARPELRGALPASRAWSPRVSPENAASRGLPGPGVAA